MKAIITTAKYNSKCAETGKKIQEGELMIILNRKPYSLKSEIGDKSYQDIIKSNLGKGFTRKKYN